jgi:hypothetical protein
MKKFWNWMRLEKSILSCHELSYVNEKAFVIEENGVIYKGIRTEYERLPKQMQIGYMIEFLNSKKIYFNIDSSKNIGEVYDILKEKIETTSFFI